MNIVTGKGYTTPYSDVMKNSNIIMRAMWVAQLKENMWSVLSTLTESERRFILNLS